MKKLLIAMTAAAVGFGAWATENAATPIFSDDFSSWQNGEAGYLISLPPGWTYTKDGESAEFGENELVVANEKLSLNTGSKVLTGTFGQTVIPSDTGLFFSSKVTFKDPSDTLPELGEGDKFALVVLDNVESVDAGYTATPSTNLWVIAKYGENGKRAYLLDTVIDPTWLTDEHTITVKFYDNVMASGTPCAGILVKVDNTENDTICQVLASYAIEGDAIDYTKYCAYNKTTDGESMNLSYLGYPQNAIAGAVKQRYIDGQLLLSNVPNDSTLLSVDFQGQGDIDDVSLAKTGASFGTDSLMISVSGSEGVRITSATDVYYAAGETVNVTFILTEGYVLEGAVKDLEPVDGVYTYSFKPNGENVVISAFKPVAEVGGIGYKTVLAALNAIAENGGKGTITLSDNVTLFDDDVDTYGLTISDGEITIDLNGKTIEAGVSEDGSTCSTIGVSGGKLLIKDSSVAKSGKVLISAAAMENGCFAIDASAGLTTIEAGQIGLIGGDYSTLKLVGGTYTDVGETFIYWEGDNEKQYDDSDKTYVATTDADSIWTVAEKQIVYYNVTVSASGATVTGVTAGTYADGKELIFTVAADEENGYENAVVKVNGNTIQPDNNGQYRVTVSGDVAIVVEASLKTFEVDATVADGATVEGLKDSYNWGETLSFTVEVGDDYENLEVKINEDIVTPNNEGNYTFEVKANVEVEVSVTKKQVVVEPLQPLPGTATEADVSAALATLVDKAVTANITTVTDYAAFQTWAAGAGTDKVAGSQNAYAAYVLDAAGLLEETEKLADADIKVKAFAQDTAAGTFALEIKIKDCEIGPNANSDKLADLIVAEGSSELDLTKFSTENVTKTVVIEGNKAKFKVKANETKDTYFFMMKFNKK